MNIHTNPEAPEVTNTHCAGSVEPMTRPDHKAKKHPRPAGKPKRKRIKGWKGCPRERTGEKIRGGYFVFERGQTTGRIKTGRIMAGGIPYEHPTFAAAVKEVARLKAKFGGEFEVFGSLSIADEPRLEADNDDWDFDPRTVAPRHVEASHG